MRCPACNATNPEDARFCGQCYQRFEATRPQAPPAQPPPAGAPDTAAPGIPVPGSGAAVDRTPGPATSRPLADTRGVGRFFVADGQAMWTCAVCGTANPVAEYTCSVCGGRMDAEAPGAATDPTDLDAAARAEALVPGLGHLRTDQTGMGAARMGIAALWLVGVVVLALGGPAGLIAAAPLAVGLVVIWLTGPGDVRAGAGGRTPRVDARRFMYLVIGVTAGVIVAGGAGVLL